MTFLLDVNALVALGFEHHEFHGRVARWVRAGQPGYLATCSITELGFARILTQAAVYGLAMDQACALLLRLKQSLIPPFTFITDNHDLSQLPHWVKNARQITDGHLAQLARANRAVLATVDGKIPGSFLIPQ